MFILTDKIEQAIIFNMWSTRDYLHFAFEEGAIVDGWWKELLADHMESTQQLMDWLMEIRCEGTHPTHDDLCNPQEDVFI